MRWARMLVQIRSSGDVAIMAAGGPGAAAGVKWRWGWFVRRCWHRRPMPHCPERQRVLDAITSAVGDGDSAALSYNQLDQYTNRRQLPASLRALVSLGLVEVSIGPRCITVYSLSERYRTVDAVEAAKLVALAQQPRPVRVAAQKPASPRAETPVGERTPRQVPSLPRLSFLERD